MGLNSFKLGPREQESYGGSAPKPPTRNNVPGPYQWAHRRPRHGHNRSFPSAIPGDAASDDQAGRDIGAELDSADRDIAFFDQLAIIAELIQDETIVDVTRRIQQPDAKRGEPNHLTFSAQTDRPQLELSM